MKTRWSIACKCAVVLLAAAGTLPATGAAKAKTSASVLKVKPGNYSPGGQLTRREFVEKTFGVKFGTEIGKYVKPGDSFDSEMGVLSKKLSNPVCGRKDALLFASGGKLDSIQLVPQSPAKRELGINATKARLAKFNKAVSKWLGVASFETHENEEGESEKGKAWRISSVFEEEGLKVETAVECTENGKTAMGFGCSLTISYDALKETRDAEARYRTILMRSENFGKPGRTSSLPTPISASSSTKSQTEEMASDKKDSKETNALEARLKKMIIPRIAFMPPATIIDAVDYFVACTKELDDPKLPSVQRGCMFIFKLRPDAPPPVIPKFEAHNIGLLDALGKICASCDCKFAIRDEMVFVMYKTMTIDPIITRSFPFTDEMKAVLDKKAGATAIHAKVCAGDDAAYEEMYSKYKAWFESQGVDFNIDDGNRRAEIRYIRISESLLITNTEENLDKIAKLLSK